MTDFTVLLADRRIRVSALYESTADFCKDYLCRGVPDFSISVLPEDIAFEREKSIREDLLEGLIPRRFSDEYLETLAVYRKIAERMPCYDTLLFHGSVIAVDGEGYLFTAKSGTGKSTHTGFWRQEFGDRAIMVNDDKPLLRVRENRVWAYGTPWDGKHHLSTNTAVPLKGICILSRAEENRIEPVSAARVLPMLLQQSYRPGDPDGIRQLLALLDKLSSAVSFYQLHCNLDPSAARVAYEGMR